MTGNIVQINTSLGGVPKRPAPEGVVTRVGIEGDLHAHPHLHGGPRQALLLICSEVIDDLAAQGFPVFYGALGENITTRGLDHRQMRVGQRYRLGEVFVELTKLRTPCSTLSVYGPGIQDAIYDARVKAGDVTSERWGKAGFYASIIQTGRVRENDIIVLVDQVV